MNLRTFKSVVLVCISFLIFNNCKAQSFANFVGKYMGDSFVLYIYDNNTYAIAGMHFVYFGDVKYDETGFHLVPYVAQEKFIVYGRANSSISMGMAILFENCADGNVIISTEDKASPNTMQRFYKKDAHCFSTPNFYKFDTKSGHLFLGNVYSPIIRAFSLPPTYNDFVIFQQQDFEDKEPIDLFILEDGKFELSNYTTSLTKEPMDDDGLEIKNYISGVRKSASNWDPIYYCNAAYKKFEGNQNDIEKNYTEYKIGDAGIYTINNLKKEISIPNYIDRQQYGYYNDTILFKYQKIESNVLNDANYKINDNSLFNIDCDEE